MMIIIIIKIKLVLPRYSGLLIVLALIFNFIRLGYLILQVFFNHLHYFHPKFSLLLAIFLINSRLEFQYVLTIALAIKLQCLSCYFW